MQPTIPHRIVIYAKDIMNITGRKERASRKLIARIKKEYSKNKDDLITVNDFCKYTGIEEETVTRFLAN